MGSTTDYASNALHGNFDGRQPQMRSADQLNPPRRDSAATTALIGVVLVAALYFGPKFWCR
jgi:hypothetical protein